MKFWVLISLLVLACGAFGQSADTSYGSVCFVTGTWTNCDSIYASDDQRAVSSTANVDEMADSAFALATSGTLDSIIVLLEGHATAIVSGQRQVDVWFSLGGTNYGDTLTVTLNRNTDTELTIRHGSDGKWNTGFTSTNINSGTMAVTLRRVVGSSGTYRIDGIKVVGWYTAAGGANSQVIMMGSGG